MNCNQKLTWHYEVIHTFIENATTGKCEKESIISLVSKKYLIPVNDKISVPILIRPNSQKRSCGKGLMDGLNFVTYQLNNIANIWAKNNVSENLLVHTEYPKSISTLSEEVMWSQIYFLNLQLGSLNLTFPKKLKRAQEMVENGTLTSTSYFKLILQKTLSKIGNNMFKSSCKFNNFLVDIIKSEKDIEKVMTFYMVKSRTNLENVVINIDDVMSTYLDIKNIKSERLGDSILVTHCKVLKPNIELIPVPM
uniref:THUMP domain-containing protein n=1 Tax=Rhabditophanes sp. KR3021 TaxID=114890 RepID=A0AC35UGU5_9BILA